MAKRMITNLMTTLTEASEWVTENSNEGCICPCCSQHAKIYTRALNSAMAAALIKLYKLHNKEARYFHVKDVDRHGAGLDKLRYWGLVEEQINEATSKRTSGMWRITNTGILFVTGKCTLYSHISLYDSKFLGFKGKQIDIGEALNKKFNYTELMAETN